MSETNEKPGQKIMIIINIKYPYGINLDVLLNWTE
jgi:hypothetical protein